MSQQRKTVVVLGATGQQGGSIVKEFLKQPSKYHVRGLTRNVHSPKAQALAQQGVDVAFADLKDFASLQRAFENAHVIYAMTDFWQEMSFDVEYGQGKAMADIAEKLPHLEHFIWAALPDGRAISEGRYTNIYHWQSKAAVTDYIRESKLDLWAKTTVVLFPNYFENCINEPRLYLPVKLVWHIVEHGTEYYKRVIAFYSQALSEGEKLDALGKFHNIPVRYLQISERQFRTDLESKMPTITALDFTEQLMIFEGCGMIFGRPEFIQGHQIEGLKLKTWDDYIKSENLLVHMKSVSSSELAKDNDQTG